MTQTIGPRELQNQHLRALKLARARRLEQQDRRDKSADLEALKQATSVASRKKGKAHAKKTRRASKKSRS